MYIDRFDPTCIYDCGCILLEVPPPFAACFLFVDGCQPLAASKTWTAPQTLAPPPPVSTSRQGGSAVGAARPNLATGSAPDPATGGAPAIHQYLLHQPPATLFGSMEASPHPTRCSRISPGNHRLEPFSQRGLEVSRAVARTIRRCGIRPISATPFLCKRPPRFPFTT